MVDHVAERTSISCRLSQHPVALTQARTPTPTRPHVDAGRRAAAAQVVSGAALLVASLGGVRAAVADEADYTRTCVQLPTSCPKKLPEGAKKEQK